MPSEGIPIRIITPRMARESDDHHSLPLLNNGHPVPLSTSLRELKRMISLSLGVQVHFPAAGDPNPECNCSLAQSIAKYGIWDMLRCRVHLEDCKYPHAHEDPQWTGVCGLCGRTLDASCRFCLNENNDQQYCPLVLNAGCRHTFHHHCYVNYTGSENGNPLCPAGCSQGLKPIVDKY